MARMHPVLSAIMGHMGRNDGRLELVFEEYGNDVLDTALPSGGGCPPIHPLHIAAAESQTDVMVNLVMKHGVDVDAQNAEGTAVSDPTLDHFERRRRRHTPPHHLHLCRRRPAASSITCANAGTTRRPVSYAPWAPT